MCSVCVAREALAQTSGWSLARTAEGDPPRVPGWTLSGVLGVGGMGKVWRAEPEEGGDSCALKVLDARWSRDPVMAARFEAEAEALRRLEHPHIVRVIELTETDDGRLCLVMELVDGCDLGRLLRGERLSLERALDIFGKVCQAVEHAHAQGFVHRDIKPSNILVGRDGTVKLADFGLAKELAAEGAASAPGGLTATTDQFGTAYYLAPERLTPGAASGPPADVFALGVLLYHTLAGRVPVGNFTLLSQLTGLPGKIDGVVARALRADPAQRTASAVQLAREAADVWHRHRAGASQRKVRRRLLAGAAVLTLALAAGGLGAWWQQRKLTPRIPVPPAPPRAEATPAAPWENSLGMKFVAVPGTRVLFSIWETRRRDFEPFRAADRASLTAVWRADAIERARRRANSIVRVEEDGDISATGTWEDPGFPVTPDHPASGINIRDAQRFCLWLTWREQGEGRLQPDQRYRLPTDAEWLAACGGETAPLRPGNLAGPEALELPWPRDWPTLPQRDPFPRLAPVASFPAEPHGLFDLSGNVAEWVQDDDENTATRPIRSQAKLRGPSARDGTLERATFAFDRPALYGQRLPFVGFRVVLELEEAALEEK